VTGSWLVFFAKCNYNDEVKEDERGKACSTHGRKEEWMHIGFGRKWQKEREHFEHVRGRCQVTASNGWVPLTLGSRTVPVPQLPASNSNSSQRLKCTSLTNSLTISSLTQRDSH
jgi:hypothetical protein